MAPKKPTAFTVFTSDWKKENAPDVAFPICIQLAGDIWQGMTTEERKPYVERAKAEAAQPKPSPASAAPKKFKPKFKPKPPQNEMTPFAAIAETELGSAAQKMLLKEQETRQMKRFIESSVRASKRNHELEKKKYYLIDVNYFDVSLSGEYHVPAELAVSEFSLEQGVTKVHHELVNPGFVVFSNLFEAQQYVDRTHKLPLPPSARGEADLGKAYTQILDFIRYKETGDLPPLYTPESSMKIVESALAFLRENVDIVSKPLRVLSAQYLFTVLKEETSLMGEVERPSNVTFDKLLDKDSYEYAPGISCSYHEELDCSKYCARSRAVRYAFMFCKEMCTDIAISLRAGFHVPDNRNFNYIVTDPEDEKEVARPAYAGCAGLCGDDIEIVGEAEPPKRRYINPAAYKRAGNPDLDAENPWEFEGDEKCEQNSEAEDNEEPEYDDEDYKARGSASPLPPARRRRQRSRSQLDDDDDDYPERRKHPKPEHRYGRYENDFESDRRSRSYGVKRSVSPVTRYERKFERSCSPPPRYDDDAGYRGAPVYRNRSPPQRRGSPPGRSYRGRADYDKPAGHGYGRRYNDEDDLGRGETHRHPFFNQTAGYDDFQQPPMPQMRQRSNSPLYSRQRYFDGGCNNGGGGDFMKQEFAINRGTRGGGQGRPNFDGPYGGPSQIEESECFGQQNKGPGGFPTGPAFGGPNSMRGRMPLGGGGFCGPNQNSGFNGPQGRNDMPVNRAYGGESFNNNNFGGPDLNQMQSYNQNFNGQTRCKNFGGKFESEDGDNSFGQFGGPNHFDRQDFNAQQRPQRQGVPPLGRQMAGYAPFTGPDNYNNSWAGAGANNMAQQGNNFIGGGVNPQPMPQPCPPPNYGGGAGFGPFGNNYNSQAPNGGNVLPSLNNPQELFKHIAPLINQLQPQPNRQTQQRAGPKPYFMN